jgi:ATP-dependent DNA helicase RecG
VLQSNTALVSQLGLQTAGAYEEDPILNNAGALLLCPFEPGQQQLDLIATRAEGAVSYRRLERAAPLLLGFEDAWQFLLECFPTRPAIVGLQRRDVRAVPQRAFREALVNAIMHRDYRQPRGRIVVLATGEPATTVKVRSPGGFPPGVQADRLLTTPSRPRNPTLAHALHLLGLAEREGIGVDTIFLEMLRDGHAEPTIVEDAGDVLCILRGGQVDLDVRSFFDDLAAKAPDLGENVRVYIGITRLLQKPTLRPEELALAAQCTNAEARDVIEHLADAGVSERLLDRSLSFRLTDSAREKLRDRLAYTPHAALDDHWDLVRAYLDSHQDINREEAARLLGLGPHQASRVLSDLYNERQLLSPVGSARGRGVRYRLAATVASTER